ncbi:ABC transporter permease [Brevibacillus borstelensis]|uniref:ABC transporter permease n=1 Tax=Brevibacillus borstelensis TaxID=45462 RepID=UPI002E1DC819|nr:ABC transporter permease [Brevibacillus borstelensis]
MLIKSLAAEWLKMRKSYIWSILAALPAVSILIGTANYYANKSVLTNGWYSLWTQVSLFYGEFFLPVLIAICCAYLCRLEHFNKNWYQVMTAPVSRSAIFISKLAIAGIMMLIVQAFFLLLYFCAGKALGLASPFPIETVDWMSRGLYASIAISAVQLALSIRIRSFAVPIGISICAAFIRLGMYVMKLGMFYPYSLLTIGMGALSQESLTIAENGLFLAMNSLFIVIVSAIAIRYLSKRDVVA